MTYVTVKQQPIYHQMTLEELLFSKESNSRVITYNTSNTRTYVVDEINQKLFEKTDLVSMIRALISFNADTAYLRDKPREALYNTFYVAKRSKGKPYLFKQIFAAQDHYIDCNTQEVFKAINGELDRLLTQHPTELNDSLMPEVMQRSTNLLIEHGFSMSEKTLEAIFNKAFRRIDAPKEELSGALYRLKSIFEDVFGALYHTTAFAYVKQRSTIDAVKRHQANESKWFGKFDLSNFFGSTTVDFIMEMFSMIYPFSEVIKIPNGKKHLENALSLCVLKGVLPQGTPISPTITNIMMIPIDHTLSSTLRNFDGNSFIYTRYADDFIISSKHTFNYRNVEKLIVDTLHKFNAPFEVNREKTRYGSSAGSNWNLGVMLNKDNNITVGYKKKRQFQAMLSSYIMDRLNGHPWSTSDIQTMEGYRNYYRMVEGETIDRIVQHVGQKFGVDAVKLIKEDLKL